MPELAATPQPVGGVENPPQVPAPQPETCAANCVPIGISYLTITAAPPPLTEEVAVADTLIVYVFAVT